MAKLKLKLVTPEKTVLEEEIDALTCPTTTGEITVLPGHVPLISSLLSGELLARKGSELEPIAITGGFVEVRPGNEIVILADVAEHVRDIDLARAEEARKRAEEAMRSGSKLSAQEYAALAASLQRNMTRIKVANKHRGKHGSSTGVIGNGTANAG